VNTVGIGLPHHQAQVLHPHEHLVTDDALQGYASPLPASMSQGDLWSHFLRRCNIQNGPMFALPPGQLTLL
jgi:hypothetical protein